MRICYIHIGMSKTGSTSIQRSLIGYEDESVSYCSFTQSNHSLPLITIFGNAPEKFRTHKKFENSHDQVQIEKTKYLQMLDMELKNKTSNTVISGEDLSSTLKEDEIERLITYLRPYYSQIKVIGYVRPIQSFAVSAFQERVKGGLRRFIVPTPEYRNRFRGWINVLGVQNVSLIKYDHSSLLEGDVVADFCSRVGVTGPTAPVGKINSTLPIEAVAVLYRYNRMIGQSIDSQVQNRSFKRMVKQLSGIGTRSFSFSKGLMDALLEQEAEDINWIERQAGFSVCDAPKAGDVTIHSEGDLIDMAKKHNEQVSDLMLDLINQSNSPNLRQGVLMRAVAGLYEAQIRSKK